MINEYRVLFKDNDRITIKGTDLSVVNSVIIISNESKAVAAFDKNEITGIYAVSSIVPSKAKN